MASAMSSTAAATNGNDAEVRKAIDALMRQRGLYDRARSALRVYADTATSSASAVPHASPPDIFEALRQAGLVDELLEAMRETGLNIDTATLEMLQGANSQIQTATNTPLIGLQQQQQQNHHHTSSSFSSSSTRTAASTDLTDISDLDPNRRYLRVVLGKGRAFLSHLDEAFFDEDEDEDEEEAGEEEEAGGGGGGGGDRSGSRRGEKRFYILNILCRGQRLRSIPVPVSVEPSFENGSSSSSSMSFIFDVQPDDVAVLAPLQTLLSSYPTPHECRLHFVLTLVSQRQTISASASSSDHLQGEQGGEEERSSSSAGAFVTGVEVTTDVIGVATLDWRTVLSEPNCKGSTLLHLIPTGNGERIAPHQQQFTSSSSSSSPTFDQMSSSSNSSSSSSPFLSSSSASPVPAGLLPMTLEIYPSVSGTTATNTSSSSSSSGAELKRADVQYALDKASNKIGDAARAFFSYSKAWWAEYRALHPSFRRRLVKIFAEDEKGEFHPVPTYIAPLVGDRAIDSPAEAARFVSLLPPLLPREAGIVGAPGARREVWPSLHAVLAAKAASPEGRAALLCSLLLGFGLDAYVAVGMKIQANNAGTAKHNNDNAVEEEATWVITRYLASAPQQQQQQQQQQQRNTTSSSSSNDNNENEDAQYEQDTEEGGDGRRSPHAGSPSASTSAGGRYQHHATTSTSSSASVYRVNCWDPLTGHRCAPGDILPTGFVYSRIAAAFSHERFYACASDDDSMATVGWDFDNIASGGSGSGAGGGAVGGEWKGMDQGLLAALPRTIPPPLSPPSLDTTSLSIGLEAVLRKGVESYRSAPNMRRQLAHTRRILGLEATTNNYNNNSSSVSDPSRTFWDDRLSFTLQQALASYETERLFGLGGVGSAEFGASVKRSVPAGCSFRAFPIGFNHISPRRIFDALNASPVARDILETPSDKTTAFAIRVRVYAYAEDTTATWVMLAVRTQIQDQ